MLLQSRQLRPLTRYFPEVATPLAEQLAPGTVLDGELVIYQDGRLDFSALQRRIRPSAMHAARRGTLTPATLVVFDLSQPAPICAPARTGPAASTSSSSCATPNHRSRSPPPPATSLPRTPG